MGVVGFPPEPPLAPLSMLWRDGGPLLPTARGLNLRPNLASIPSGGRGLEGEVFLRFHPKVAHCHPYLLAGPKLANVPGER